MARYLTNREKSKGEAPGALIFLGAQKTKESAIHLIQYNASGIIEKQLQVEDISPKLAIPGHTTWLNIYGLHDIALIRHIGDTFTISSLVLEDLLNPDQRPKLVETEAAMAVYLKLFPKSTTESQLNSEQITLYLTDNLLITFQEQRTQQFEDVRRRIRNHTGRIRNLQADYLFYALIDTVADSYLHHIEYLGSRIEALDAELHQTTNRKLIQKIYAYKGELLYIRKAVRPVKEITIKLHKSDNPLVKNKTLRFFEDLDDLTTQAIESLDIYYTMITDQLNLYNTNLSNKANDVMKVLTLFASIFIPLTFIAGIYGTNFDYIPELKWHYGYFGMLAVMGIVAVIMLIFFKRKRFL
ncbi:MAG: magnesium/cobalt transporter CorA [Bacteroidia bacterium]|nr:magnesium/cobalt transporter CorA [Bacteroidales bacterium]NCD42741.1 magnesium/cobalt transporter CorA [Bacteroidia bacterium]HPE86812.1 magnesium/cobalt transporter CorA [Bacteroidales bacterium]